MLSYDHHQGSLQGGSSSRILARRILIKDPCKEDPHEGSLQDTWSKILGGYTSRILARRILARRILIKDPCKEDPHQGSLYRGSLSSILPRRFLLKLL
jgi:hypothetical protein